MKKRPTRFNFLLLLGCFLFMSLASGFSQTGIVEGTITDEDGPLIGATVLVKGTMKGATTDIDGNYAIVLAPGTYTISASFIGYSAQDVEVTITDGQTTTMDFNLAEGISFSEVVIIGSRAANRTNTDAPVPIDVINVSKLAVSAPQTNINQILHQTAPSFSSNTQTISDGTDHIDPASLRGLGPDQVLVLMNGKRRHTSSLVNVNGTFGRGNVGTDLNAIPAAALNSIEVLRDGAAAQYGSDAIAGVINLNLKRTVNELTVNLTTGGNFTNKIGPFNGETKDVDGEVFNLGVNYGLPIGKEGGFINFTGEMDYRGATNRMAEFEGQIFAGYNGIERLAAADGLDVTALSMGQVQSYAQDVSYFDSNLKGLIAGAPTMDSLASLLNFNTTDQELAARGQQRSDYNMRVGQSRLRGGKLFVNMAIPLGENMEVYSFGGIGFREGESGCFYRLPAESRTMTSIYPNGTVPKINSNISDQSIAMGIKGMIGNWSIDISNVYGKNSFIFLMTDTHNATLGTSSPTSFNSGGHAFTQNTGNLDLSQYFDELGSINGINLAFGAEYRFENFEVIPGTEQSYGNYDVNGVLVTPVTHDSLITRDFYGDNRPSGAQCFAGFLPTNEIDATRSSVAGYVDAEFDISDEFLIGTAIRFENYSDFGSTFNYKIAARYKLSENLALRGATSTGFRAPSLHQIHFSRTSTIFTLDANGNSVPQEVGVFANTSRAAKLLGIPQLREETSQNFSLGFTAKIPESRLSITIDAYQVNIDDRVVLTGQFGPENEELANILQQAGATRAAFFANAIDTESQGLDVVISHSLSLGTSGNSLQNNFAATFSQTKQKGDIKASDVLERGGLVNTYFNQEARIYLEQAVPRVKLTLSNNLNLGKVSFYLRNTFFGETTEATTANIFNNDLELIDDSVDPYNSGKVVTDLSVGFAVSNDLSITLGANNLFDVFPDEVDDIFTSSGRFVYSRRSPQFSYSGRHLFGRLVFTLR